MRKSFRSCNTPLNQCTASGIWNKPGLTKNLVTGSKLSSFYLLTIYGNYNWNLVKFVRAEGAVGVTYNCWVIVTMLYIIFVLLSKRRRADAMGGGTPGTTDAHARIAFTLKTIPTMVFVGVVLFVITIIDSFFFSLRTSDMGYQALYVLNLLAVLVGEPLLLEFSRGALRRLAKLS